MSRVKKASQRSKALPMLGAAGLSLALASGVSAAANKAGAGTSARNTSVNREITLYEDELSDVSLATFHVFDKESESGKTARLRLWWWLLHVCASALVHVRKRCLFAPTAPTERTGAQTRSEVSVTRLLPPSGRFYDYAPRHGPMAKIGGKWLRSCRFLERHGLLIVRRCIAGCCRTSL